MALYLAGTNLAVILLLNIAISTITVFFAPAELAMIPVLVPRAQLLAANGIFTLTLNAAFALGFALLGPLVVKVAGPEAVIVVVAGLYFLAAIFCVTLPASPPPPSTEESPHSGLGVGEAGGAMGSTLGQLRKASLHPRPSGDHLVAHLSRAGGLARRRAGRPRARPSRRRRSGSRRRTSRWSSCRSGSGS